MRSEEWPDLLALLQSALNNTRSTQRGNVSPITAFTGMEPSPPISKFMRSTTAAAISVNNAQRERLLNIKRLQENCG